MRKFINSLLNKEELLSNDDIQALAQLIAQEKRLDLTKVEFGEDGPEMDTKDGILYMNNNKDADWMKLELKDFTNFKGLRYMNNPKMHTHLLNEPITVKFYNSMLVFVVLHELRHLEQRKILVEDYEYHDPVVVKNLILSMYNVTPMIYALYHDKIYYEFDANINSIMELRKCDIDPFFKQYMAYKILVSYTNNRGLEFSSPQENTKKTFGEKLDNRVEDNLRDYIYNNEYISNEDLRAGSNTTKIKKINSYFQSNY